MAVGRVNRIRRIDCRGEWGRMSDKMRINVGSSEMNYFETILEPVRSSVDLVLWSCKYVLR